jgi:hypothetical protein
MNFLLRDLWGGPVTLTVGSADAVASPAPDRGAGGRRGAWLLWRPWVVAGVLFAGTAAAAPADIVPHRAFYELRLAGRSSTLVDADGALAVEWRAQCGGVASRQRLGFVGSLLGGGELDYDVRVSTWEAADDRRMRFSMRSFQNGRLMEEYRGQARMPEGGGPGRATYTVPAGREMRLPPDTLFPTAHMEQLIDEAAAGAAVASAALFDGAGVGGDALTFVTAAIGDPLPSPADGEQAWPMALAYHTFAEDEGEAPLFELSFQLSDEGVMRNVVLDYGPFALRARLTRFERLSAPRCE